MRSLRRHGRLRRLRRSADQRHCIPLALDNPCPRPALALARDNHDLPIIAALLATIWFAVLLPDVTAEVRAVPTTHRHRASRQAFAQLVEHDENRLGPTFMSRLICNAETRLTPLAHNAITARWSRIASLRE